MAELFHAGPDGVRMGSGEGSFDPARRYFREVASGSLSRMVAGPSVRIHLDTGDDQVEWSFKVGGFQLSPDGLGYPTNTVTEFSL